MLIINASLGLLLAALLLCGEDHVRVEGIRSFSMQSIDAALCLSFVFLCQRQG